jgi:hypothetical protein
MNNQVYGQIQDINIETELIVLIAKNNNQKFI